MMVKDILQTTPCMEKGMLVSQGLAYCHTYQVSVLPVCEEGKVIAELSIDKIFRNGCIPAHILPLASLLHNKTGCLLDTEKKITTLLKMPIDKLIHKKVLLLESDALITKALLMMIKDKKEVVFITEQGKYLGMVTLQSVSKALIQQSQNQV